MGNRRLAPATDRMVTNSYTFRVLLQQHGHLLHLDFPRPTNGPKSTSPIAAAGSAVSTSLATSPAVGSLAFHGWNQPHPPRIALRFDGWMLPKAGVGFVWMLEREVAPVGAA